MVVLNICFWYVSLYLCKVIREVVERLKMDESVGVFGKSRFNYYWLYNIIIVFVVEVIIICIDSNCGLLLYVVYFFLFYLIFYF